jgi:hypothetical protein
MNVGTWVPYRVAWTVCVAVWRLRMQHALGVALARAPLEASGLLVQQ